MTNWVTPWSLWPSKNWSVELMGRYGGFLLLKVNILSIQSALFSWLAKPLEHKYVLWTLFVECTIKVVRKVNNPDQTIQ